MVFADSVNLARRLSSKNENDLLQENILESELTEKQCLVLAVKLSSSKHLPKECLEYKDVVQVLQKRPTKSDNSIAFQGMGSSALAAAKARERGQQNYAQIQRRFTNTRRFSKNNN